MYYSHTIKECRRKIEYKFRKLSKILLINFFSVTVMATNGSRNLIKFSY